MVVHRKALDSLDGSPPDLPRLLGRNLSPARHCRAKFQVLGFFTIGLEHSGRRLQYANGIQFHQTDTESHLLTLPTWVALSVRLPGNSCLDVSVAAMEILRGSVQPGAATRACD